VSRLGTKDLFARAASCFQMAGQADDAGRCYERAGQYVVAAQVHAQADRWAEAARCYELGKNWTAAADAYRRLRLPVDAAESYIRAGDNLTAAWVLADEAGLFGRARHVASGGLGRPDGGRERPRGRAESEADIGPARELVLARCDLGGGDPESAARRLWAVVGRVAELAPSGRRQQVIDWALVIAHLTGRTDLAASFHAACHAVGIVGAAKRWAEWADRVLGDTTGVPEDDELAPAEPRVVPAKDPRQGEVTATRELPRR
jgi:hypothetical protein